MDLVCTDIAGVKARVVQGVSDHSMVETIVKFKMPAENVIKREVWAFRDADWEGVKAALVETKWNIEASNDPSAATQEFTTTS